MTTPVAVVPLSFDATDLQASNLSVYFEIVRGLYEQAKVRGEDDVIPALEGRWETNRKKDILPIVLKGMVQADPTLTDVDDIRSSFWTNYRTIRTLFEPDRARADLVAVLPNGVTLTISARPMNIITDTVIDGEYWSGTVELEGYDDWAESS